jgi:putative peptidoglycan binding protein
MKKIKLLTLIGTAVVGLGQLALAGPRGGGGGFAGGHFGGSHFGGNPGGIRAAPAFSGGARFGGQRIGGLSRVPQQFSYYGGARISSLGPHALTRQLPGRSTTRYTGSKAQIADQQSRAGSVVTRTRASDPRASTAANRPLLNTNHALERHEVNWHRDWDRRHAHFHNGHVFVFINGFWYGFFPWDYFPYYAYDYYPYDYYGYPYDYSDYYPYNYDEQSSYVNGDQYGSNATVSAVQSQLAKLGYYRGAIDGIVGDETEAALARYQEDHDLSVTGTLTAATLQSLGLARKAS